MASKHDRMRRQSGGHHYRGFDIALDDSLPQNRKGRYRAAGLAFSTLSQVRDYIDSELRAAT